MTKLGFLASLAIAVLSVTMAQATEKPKAVGSALMGKLSACRQIADRDQRLDCFDRETAVIDEAIERKDIVVVDREAVRETHKSLFGFDIGKLPFLGGGDTEGDESEKEITAKIATASSMGNGRWQITLDNGAIWQTTESSSVLEPRAGDPVRIRRAALGSYFINVSGQRAVRARRSG